MCSKDTNLPQKNSCGRVHTAIKQQDQRAESAETAPPLTSQAARNKALRHSSPLFFLPTAGQNVIEERPTKSYGRNAARSLTASLETFAPPASAAALGRLKEVPNTPQTLYRNQFNVTSRGAVLSAHSTSGLPTPPCLHRSNVSLTMPLQLCRCGPRSRVFAEGLGRSQPSVEGRRIQGEYPAVVRCGPGRGMGERCGREEPCRCGINNVKNLRGRRREQGGGGMGGPGQGWALGWRRRRRRRRRRQREERWSIATTRERGTHWSRKAQQEGGLGDRRKSASSVYCRCSYDAFTGGAPAMAQA